jgi:hypothetical protein
VRNSRLIPFDDSRGGTGQVRERSKHQRAGTAVATALRLSVLGLVMLGSACSVNALGTAQSAVVPLDSGVAKSVRAIGLHLDAWDRNPSLNVGSYRAVHVFPAHCSAGRSLPAYSFARITGFQLRIGPGEFSLTLGFRQVFEAALPRTATGQIRRFSFDPNHLDRASFQIETNAICPTREDDT